MSDMLRDIVQRAVDGGWRLNGYVVKVNIVHIETDLLWINPLPKVANISTEIMPPFIMVEIITKRSTGTRFYTLADLIADPGAMKAVYGEYKYGDLVKTCRCANDYDCSSCVYRILLPLWQYHDIQALKLLHEGKDAVKYLWDNLPNKK